MFNIREWIGNKPFRAKITILMMLACSVMALLMCSAFVVSDIVNIKQRLVNEITAKGYIIGQRAASRIAFEQSNKAKEDLTAFTYKPSVQLACIYDNLGQYFAHYKVLDATNICPQNPPYGHLFTWYNLTIHQPIIIDEGIEAGSIYIVSDLREIYAHVSNILITITLITLGSLLIAYMVAARLQSIVSKPLTNLLSITRAVGEGAKYNERAKKMYDDEIGELAESFNTMMVTIEEANENLEEKVRQRTKALEQAKAKAESASKAKSEFLRNMSHEFRTPLHAMHSFSIYGMREYSTKERETLLKYFNRINDGTSRLLKLVDGILSLARLESGQEIFHIRKNSLISSIKSVARESSSLVQDKQLTLEIIEPDFDPIACFDSDKMVQVFTNLVSNAIKFTPEGKKIIVSFKQTSIAGQDGKSPKNAIAISVADQGCGIPEEELATIFDKFVQSTRTNTGAGGTGLGLSIVTNILRGHDGIIEAANNEYGGTTFTFTIPQYLPEGQKVVTILDD